MIIRKSIIVKFIPILLLIFFNVNCFFNEFLKTNRSNSKSNIVGATINDNEASVEIREMMNDSGNVINKGYNHPFYFSEAGLANILSSIHFKERGFFKGKGTRKLFRHEELQKIIPPIINAFSMATPSQDILVFTTSHKILLSDRQSYFSMFVMENELHLVFSTINSKKSVNDSRTYTTHGKAKLKDPFDVKKSSFWTIIPMGGQRLASGRQNWLIFDLGSDLFGAATVSDVDRDPVQVGSSMKAVENRVGASKVFVEEKKKYQDIRAKLKELNSLKNEGLISEEDYNIKKKELLNKF